MTQGRIDADYMNSRFVKYMKLLETGGRTPGDLIEEAKAELHKTLQLYHRKNKNMRIFFLHDIERGDVNPEGGKRHYGIILQNTSIVQK